MWEVIILFEGYAKKIAANIMEANCSCVLIKGPKKIIVDTMTAWDGPKIIKALAKLHVKPEEIDHVICTHSHTDHIGNNNLFLNADHIVGSSLNKGTIFHDIHFLIGSYCQLYENLEIIKTPGHTYDDISVIVVTMVDGKPTRVAITGDLFEREEDIHDAKIWEEMGNKSLRNIQAKSRFTMIRLVDFIIPGHGKMFKVTEQHKRLVEAQINGPGTSTPSEPPAK